MGAYILFGPGSESWESVFHSAYSNLHYGDKDLKQSIANRLHKLFLEGVRLWLDETWSLRGIARNTDKKPSRRTELESFSNEPDPSIALWAACRRRDLLVALKGLREGLKGKAAMLDLVELRCQISKTIPYKSFLGGLRIISPESNPAPKAFFTASWVAAESMAEAMLTAELEAKGYELKRTAVKTYLKEGETLLAALSSLRKRWS